MFRMGEPVKREYRGQRSVESLADFVRRQLKNPVVNLTSVGEIHSLIDVCIALCCGLNLCAINMFFFFFFFEDSECIT
jgi:hypothetical protein